MNVFKTSLVKVVLATTLITGGAVVPAYAATATANLEITITIDKSCIVTTAPVVFGNHVATIGSTPDITGSVTVQCTNGSGYTVALDGGGANNIAGRQMTNGTETIGYQLHLNSDYSTVWGDGTSGSTASGTGTGFGTGAPYDRVHTVYAEANILGSEVAGTYSDTVTATVTF